MIINKLINEETFYSLIEMFSNEGKEVSNKISGNKFKSFVVESEQYIFTDDLSDINKDNLINESFVGIDTDAKEYIQHHGKKPNGAGKWIFGIGSRNKKDWFSFDGNFTDAKNAAYEEAQSRGKKKIYVMEEFNFKFIDAGFKIIKESNNMYRVSLIVNDEELSVTKTLTENSAKKIGSEWLLNKLIEIDLQEKKMTKKEKEKSEDIVHGMKKKIKSFKDRYGKNAKEVMYATANKLAKESANEDDVFKDFGKRSLKIWKYNKITGYWNPLKTIEVREDGEKWLKVFQEDEPKEFFKLSSNKPNNNPTLKSNMKESLEQKLKLLIEEESFKELSSEPTYRKPYKAVEAEPQFVDGWKIVDNLGQALAGVYKKDEAKTLVDILNSTSEVKTMGYKDLYIKDGEGEKIKDRSLKGVKLKESTKNFKVKFEQKSEDNSQITTGEKVIAAPDQVIARKRVEEDSKDLPGFRVVSVTEIK